MSAPPLTRFQEFRPVPVDIQEAAFDGDRTVGSRGHSAYAAAEDKQVTVLIGLDLSAAFDIHTAPTPADRVRSDWNGVVVAPVLPQLPVTVCQARQPCTSHQQSTSTSASLKDPYWDSSGLLSTAVQWVTSLLGMAYGTTSMLTTHSFVSPCALTTQPPDSQRSLHAHPTSDHMWYMQNGLQLNPDKSKPLCSSERHNS